MTRAKQTILILVVGTCLLALITVSVFLLVRASRQAGQVHAQALLRFFSGFYVFDRESDGVRYTCDLKPDGACLLGVEIPGGSYSKGQGDVPGAVTCDGSGRKLQDGLKGKWEIHNNKVCLFVDGRLSAELVIQGNDLMANEGARYVRF